MWLVNKTHYQIDEIIRITIITFYNDEAGVQKEVINRSALSQSTGMCHSLPLPVTEEHSLYTSREYINFIFLYICFFFYLFWFFFIFFHFVSTGRGIDMEGWVNGFDFTTVFVWSSLFESLTQLFSRVGFFSHLWKPWGLKNREREGKKRAFHSITQ